MVTVVDNYQGEENQVVLLSLVRSNAESGTIGFLSALGRICVSLTRAKRGLYVVGNFDNLARRSKTWKAISDVLYENGSIGRSLKLQCSFHPGSAREVSRPEDFDGTQLCS